MQEGSGATPGTCTVASDVGGPCIPSTSPYGVTGCYYGLLCPSGTCTIPASTGPCVLGPTGDTCLDSVSYCDFENTMTCIPLFSLGATCLLSAQCRAGTATRATSAPRACCARNESPCAAAPATPSPSVAVPDGGTTPADAAAPDAATSDAATSDAALRADGATPPDAVTAVDAGCEATCAANNPSGAATFVGLLLQNCGCTVGAACAGACSTETA